MGGGCFSLAFSEEIKEVDIGESVINAEKGQSTELQKFQSGESLNRRMLDSNPSGNGDITSILRILPNVQFDNAQLRSTTPGEIDPANISISGGLFYQNNFQLDGFNMNNDINPLGYSNMANTTSLPGGSQGLNIDTSLLESIKVQDSNVSAAYGGFTGGVVEANTRRPVKSFGANISYQITQGNADPNAFSLTKYHLFGDSRDSFLNSTSAANQPQFIKHLFRSSIESKLNDKSGVIASFTTTQSFIPLNAYAGSQIDSTLDDARKTQKRQSYNFFIKGYYDISEKLRLEGSYTYAPQFNNYFLVNTKDSSFDLQSGGHQAGLKALWDNALGLLTAQSNFSYMENSRSGAAQNMFNWYYSTTKNWNPNGNNAEGSYGNIDTTQITWNTKLTQDFKPLEFGIWSNKFHTGLEAGYIYAGYEQIGDTMVVSNTFSVLPLSSTQSCIDIWCDSGIVDVSKLPTAQQTRWNGNQGQYASRATLYKAGKINLTNLTLAAFIEDDMRFDLKSLGELNARVGLRLDYDTYMEKRTFAPRFSLNYIAPWSAWGELGKNLSTQFSFGANRYYGRNLFDYALMDGRSSLRWTLNRGDNPNLSWENVSPTQDRNTTNFQKIKVPYADELMAGIMQRIFLFNLGAKYIHRFGRDEVRRACVSANGGLQDEYDCMYWDNTSDHTYYYTNTGRSETDVVTLSLQNNAPLDTFGIKHFYLLAFDWTNIKRNYADYNVAITNAQFNDEIISYDGQFIRYADRPAENFVRPWTLRFNTTHTFNISRTKWLWNNFFRLRSGYKTMAAVTNIANQDIYPETGERVATFKAFQVPYSFTWDMRLGFEIDAYKGNTLYVNVDIYNVLNRQNIAIASASYSPSAGTTAVPVYEVGRQFWVQVGYKF